MADNHTGEELSAQFRDASRFWIQRVFVPLVVGIGLLGNVITIVVLTRRRMRSSTNVYLTALAVSDLLYLLFVFTLSLQHYPNIHEPSFLLYWQYYGFGIWFTDATTYTSIWLTVSFTVERYIAVCHPMRGRLICTESRAKKVITLVYVFCFVTTVTTAFEHEATVIQDPRDNSTLVYCVKSTKMALNKTYRTVFYWFTTMTFVFVPLILLGIFNSYLIHVVRKSQQRRCRMTQVEQSDSIQTQENKITITLIAVVILFMVCQIPSAITLIYELFHQTAESGVTEQNIRFGLGNIFNFLVTINAACNFMLYCALSDKYRRTFLRTFLPSCYNLRSPSRHNTMYSSMYDGTSMLRQSVRTSSLHVPALSCNNGEVFRHASNYTARKEKNEGQLPMQPAKNNVPSLLVESHLSLSSSIPN